MQPQLKNLSDLHCSKAQFVDQFEDLQASLHGSRIIAPLLEKQPKSSPLFFEEISCLFSNEKMWNALLHKLDPAEAVETAPQSRFHQFSAEPDNIQEEAQPERDEEKEAELNEAAHDFTAGVSSWTENECTWEWNREHIDYPALTKLDFRDAEGLATNLYNLFCVELDPEQGITHSFQITSIPSPLKIRSSMPPF